MSGNHGLGGSAAIHGGEAGDARMTALTLMTRALEQLDGDKSIPSIIGAQLQSAIDVLWMGSSSDRPSTNLH
jgi:hypothetical protein